MSTDFFLSGLPFKDTGNSQGTRKREGTMFHSSVTLTSHEYSDINF